MAVAEVGVVMEEERLTGEGVGLVARRVGVAVGGVEWCVEEGKLVVVVAGVGVVGEEQEAI